MSKGKKLAEKESNDVGRSRGLLERSESRKNKALSSIRNRKVDPDYVGDEGTDEEMMDAYEKENPSMVGAFNKDRYWDGLENWRLKRKLKD